MSEFGLIEMTRQRSRGTLSQTIFTHCPYCTGSGLVKTHESVAIEMERELKKVIQVGNQYALKAVVHPELNKFLEEGDKEFFMQLAETLNARLEWEVNDELHLNEYRFLSSINQKVIEV